MFLQHYTYRLLLLLSATFRVEKLFDMSDTVTIESGKPLQSVPLPDCRKCPNNSFLKIATQHAITLETHPLSL